MESYSLYTMVTPTMSKTFFPETPDYMIDAIDQGDAKVALLLEASKRNIPVLSVMGTGHQLTAENFCLADISKTHDCPLARKVRLKLRKEGLEKGLQVLYAPGPKLKPEREVDSDRARNSRGKNTPGSLSFVPPVAGMLAAGAVVRCTHKTVSLTKMPRRRYFFYIVSSF
jgi:tRNA A37 threonylcarbamoyladenosine dehydratase